jgi:hypothetical protein
MTINPDEVKWDNPPPKLTFSDSPILSPDSLINLLSVYGTQFGSYTTLLWQVPALSLTAQSFLLTIALGSTTANFARIIVAVLSMVLVIASWSLMHEQRGHALNHGTVANKIAERLQLQNLEVSVDDGVPKSTTAAGVWTERSNNRKMVARAGLMYGVWRICIGLFFIADILIIISAARGYTWFGPGS